MSKILLAWIGMADLNAAKKDASGDLGPIVQALRWGSFDQVVLLSDHEKKTNKQYSRWVAEQTGSSPSVVESRLSSPVAFGEIYEAASEVATATAAQNQGAALTFHLSPGTPAMAAVWIILAKTRFEATLVESSRDHGVKVASIPFDISADYIPNLLRRPDEQLLRLTQGLPPEAPEFDDIIHRCAEMKRLIAKARRIAPRNLPVLLLGESGTGKELLSRSIHKASLAKDGPFIPVNCGAIPSELVESELFGHEKGAFTGANTTRVGFIESANGGTLFLDEVGELPLSTQVKLLRVLQDQEVTRVGAVKGKKVAFRVVAATNRDLYQEVADGNFREDLFYRIAAAVLHIPPIRERNGDVGLIVDSVLEKINQESVGQPGFEHKKLSASARNLLIRHPWPGNVREVTNTLQRAAVWSSGDTINVREAEDAILQLPSKKDESILNKPLGNGLDIQQIVNEVCIHYLSRAMTESSNNKTKAAELVGLPSYQTLTNWLKRYGLET